MRTNTILLTTALAISAATVSAQIAGPNPAPHIFVYKTSSKTADLVPVVLSEDKKTVESYPDPHDIKAAGKNAGPVSLHKGYYMDKRGISPNVAFLKTTYKTYGKLKTAPSAEALYKMIKVKDPLVTLCDCGPASAMKDPKTELNKMIDNGTLLTKCKVLKSTAKK